MPRLSATLGTMVTLALVSPFAALADHCRPEHATGTTVPGVAPLTRTDGTYYAYFAFVDRPPGAPQGAPDVASGHPEAPSDPARLVPADALTFWKETNRWSGLQVKPVRCDTLGIVAPPDTRLPGPPIP